MQIMDLNQLQIFLIWHDADKKTKVNVSMYLLIITIKRKTYFILKEVGQSYDPTEQVLKQLFYA